MISEAEERKEEARARKKGGGRPGHGSWGRRGVCLPETSTNEVRNCLQLFVANMVAALKVTGRGSAAHACGGRPGQTGRSGPRRAQRQLRGGERAGVRGHAGPGCHPSGRSRRRLIGDSCGSDPELCGGIFRGRKPQDCVSKREKGSSGTRTAENVCEHDGAAHGNDPEIAVSLFLHDEAPTHVDVL